MHSVEGMQQRQLIEQRGLATLLYRYGQAFSLVNSQGLPDIWEIFPLWTETEINQMQVAKIKAIMMRHAARKGHHNGRGKT